MTNNPNVSIQQRFVAAVFAGDGDTIRALAHPDFALHEGSGLPFAGTYRGGEGFLRFLGIFNDTFEIETLAPLRTYETEDPDYLACEFELRAVLRGNGERFDSTLVEIWNFRDGQVLSITPHYFNATTGRG